MMKCRVKTNKSWLAFHKITLHCCVLLLLLARAPPSPSQFLYFSFFLFRRTLQRMEENCVQKERKKEMVCIANYVYLCMHTHTHTAVQHVQYKI